MLLTNKPGHRDRGHCHKMMDDGQIFLAMIICGHMRHTVQYIIRLKLLLTLLLEADNTSSVENYHLASVEIVICSFARRPFMF